jgi:DNA-binding CsgD family transcriptional regulator
MPRFVGRLRELALLQREFELVERGRGRVLLVSADPGVGKTRLLLEFTGRVQARALTLIGRGSPLTESVPLGIIAEPLQAHLAGLPPGAQGGLPWPEVAGESVTGEPVSLLKTFGRLRGVLVEMADECPVVLILDDVHRADRPSWGLISHLARNPLPAPVLVIAATRVAPVAEDPDLAATLGALVKDGIAEQLRLAAFGPEEVAQLAAAALGPQRADPELVAWLHSRAGGNPLFTTALLEDLAHNPVREQVPASVRERVTQIRAALPSPAGEVLDLAAVLGHSFPPATIAAIAGAGSAAQLDRLVSERLLVERPDGYDFAHPLLQEAVEATLGAARRRELHEQIGRRLVAAPLAVRAYHIGLGALPGDLAAVEVLRQAAAEAQRLQAHREALRHLTTALALVPPTGGDLRRDLLQEIAGQAAAVADHVVGIPALKELIALTGDDPVRRGTAQMGLASFLSTGAADVAAGEAAAAQAIEAFRQAGADDRLAGALNERAWIRGMGGDFAGQLAGCREALVVAERDSTGDESTVLHIVGPLGAVLAMLGDFAAAVPVHARAGALAAATHDPQQIGWNAAVAHLTQLYQGRFAEAAAIVDPVVDPAPLEADIATPWRTLTDWFLGRWELGRHDCAVVREMFPVAPSAHMAWTYSVAALLEVAIAEPAPSRAGDGWAAQAVRVYGDRDLYFFTGLHHWALGTRSWLAGDLPAAATHLRRSGDWLRRTEVVGFEGLLLAELPEVLVALGELGEARDAARRAEQIAARLGTGFSVAQAAYAAGLVAQAEGDKASAIAAFGNAFAGYARAGTPFLEARSHEHLASLVPARRLDHLASACRHYTALPATRHRDRVLALLRAEGPAGRRAAQQVGVLTPRERQIAELAARGLASHDIAAKLHLSTRTVETHLGRAYHKLGIGGRPGLAEALEALGAGG